MDLQPEDATVEELRLLHVRTDGKPWKDPKEFARQTARRYGRKNPGLCEWCNCREAHHRHHRDYERPLDFDWVCALCHRRYHSLVKKGLDSKRAIENVKRNRF